MKGPPRFRLLSLCLLLLAALGLMGWRAFDLQVARPEQFLRRAQRQYYQKVVLPPRRGAIYDRRGRELAVSIKVPSLYALPPKVKNPEALAQRLAPILGVTSQRLRELLQAERSFVWLKRHLTPRQEKEVMALHVKGVGTLPETRRFYPHGELAAPLLGFVGVDAQGLEGIELAYDHWLKAPPRVMVLERDALGRWIYLPSREGETAGPCDLRLTIDLMVQYTLEKELKAGIIETEAKGAVGVALDPWSGEILAMASLPSFNPNLFYRYPRERWRNRAVSALFEPGSLLKVFLVAAALEEGLVRPEDLFFCEGGRYRVGRVVIHDVKPHRWLTVERIIQHSSNIGAAKMGEVLGPYRYYQYLRAFGFGGRTGVGLPGEERGILRSPKAWTKVDLVTLAFGQGMAATPLQLATAFSAIANGGLLLRPYVVKEVLNRRGQKVRSFGPEVRRRALSSTTCRRVLSMMKKVVSREGTGSRAQLQGYTVAGKTGTSQKFDPSVGGYSREHVVASFVGFLPAEHPRAVILIMVDEPKKATHGGTAAAPIFRRVAEELVRYWGIPPEGKLALLPRRPSP